MSFDFSKLLDWQYLSNPYPPTEFQFRNIFLIVSGIAIMVTILAWVIIGRFQKKYEIYESLKYRIFYFFLFSGIISAILVFFRIEGIPYFSSRFVVLILLTGILIWFLITLYYFIFKLPKEKIKYEDKLRKEKYLPKKRKRR